MRLCIPGLSFVVHSCIHPTPVGSECLGSSGNDASDPPHIVMLICNIMIGARRWRKCGCGVIGGTDRQHRGTAYTARETTSLPVEICGHFYPTMEAGDISYDPALCMRPAPYRAMTGLSPHGPVSNQKCLESTFFITESGVQSLT